MKEFPNAKLFMIAVLDTVVFGGLTVSAAGVTPVTTVILLHTSTPFMILGSYYLFPERLYSLVKMRGVILISVAGTLSLIGPFLMYFYPSSLMLSTPMSCLFYFAMCALHGISMLLKVRFEYFSLYCRCTLYLIASDLYPNRRNCSLSGQNPSTCTISTTGYSATRSA